MGEKVSEEEKKNCVNCACFQEVWDENDVSTSQFTCEKRIEFGDTKKEKTLLENLLKDEFILKSKICFEPGQD